METGLQHSPRPHAAHPTPNQHTTGKTSCSRESRHHLLPSRRLPAARQGKNTAADTISTNISQQRHIGVHLRGQSRTAPHDCITPKPCIYIRSSRSKRDHHPRRPTQHREHRPPPPAMKSTPTARNRQNSHQKTERKVKEASGRAQGEEKG
ncbi:unnamed protein product [Rhodiola kirilowii]